jgi:outer membrane protein OmpA-like peptidoglycan-associated protein
MAPARTLRIVFIAVGLAFVAPSAADAQGVLGRMKKKAEEAAKKKVEDRTEKAAGQATDAALDRVECKVSDQACVDRAESEGKPVVVTDEDGGVVAGGASVTMKPGQGAWANYDFKPGERILFFDDFTKDEVGDFPRRMEFKSGALEIVEWEGARWLRANQTSQFYVTLPEALPERFTMEFDYALPAGEVWIYTGEPTTRRIEFGGGGSAELSNSDAQVSASGTYGDADREKIRRGRVLVDGKYAKVYIDDKRILNVPNADLPRSNKLLFWMDASVQHPALFGNFRIAAGGRKLYDALTEKGRVATQGIYFDTGSDRIRPESTPTLKEIGQMLNEHADLKLTIEGHTDNVGSAQGTKELSQKRAEAVKAYLVEAHGIDESRLTSTGLGDAKPAAKNDTPEGRQQNRRVELVKM